MPQPSIVPSASLVPVEIKPKAAARRPIEEIDDNDFESLLEHFLNPQSLVDGEMVKGKVLAVESDFVLVDVGGKTEGRIALAEFKNADGTLIALASGDEIDVIVEEAENTDGSIVLSKEKADRQKVWNQIEEAQSRGELVEGIIVARIKGGLQVDIGVKAFLPGSQVDLRPVRNLEKLLGQSFKFRVIKFNKKRGNIVLSRRVLLEEERQVLKQDTLKKLVEGAIMTGQIKNITSYGAFVDLGGIDGLLHITDMSWGRLQHPTDIFQIGDYVTVRVLKFDPSAERVSLGLKQLQQDPWDTVMQKFPPNTRTTGKVVNLADYGAFVELAPGIEGLIHVSEMSWTKRVKHPSKLVSIGDLVEVMVLDIDLNARRISLGMKQIEPNPWTLLAEKYPVGSIIRGKIRNVTDFGIFIGVEEGIDGLVHISDLSWTQKVKHPSEAFQKGQEVEAVVLAIDVERERFSLGIKQLSADPWQRIPERYYQGRIATGKVSKVTDFGAFVELEEGVEGLVHVSELSAERVDDPAKLLKSGDDVTCEVLHVDPAERRISLSIKSLQSNAEKKELAEYVKRQTAEQPASSGSGALAEALKRKLGQLQGG